MSIVSTNHTALCVIPPESVWRQIQAIRSTHDKAYDRWMPHINFIYPFVPEVHFDDIQSQLEHHLEKIKPFEIEFDTSSFDFFRQKGLACTFHLRPKQTKDIVKLQNLIQQQLDYSIPSKKPFEAHLTLGQSTRSRISDLLVEMKAHWYPIKFLVDRIYFISREDDPTKPFTVKKQIFLLGRTEPTDEPLSPEESIPVTPVPQTLPRKASKTSLCVVPPNEFSSRFLLLFEDTSFQPLKPFRIILEEYDENHPIDPQLESKLASISKFTLDFAQRSICFNYSDARLFLKPMDPQVFERFRFTHAIDGTMTLGTLDKKDLSEVGDRYAQRWANGTNEFEVDRLHLIDENDRFQATFPLRSQCFS